MQAFSSCGEQSCSSLPCTGFSLLCLQEHRLSVHGFQQLKHVDTVVVPHGLQNSGSAVVAHGLSVSAACGIFSDCGLNPCPLHWQADFYPLCLQGNPNHWFFSMLFSLHVIIFPPISLTVFDFQFHTQKLGIFVVRKMFEIISILLNLLSLVLCPCMSSVLKNVPCVPEKNVHSAIFNVMS